MRRLTSDPARQVPHSRSRAHRARACRADLLLFDPATVGISALKKVKDLPGGGTRMMRDPRGVHGVWVNGLQVFDGVKYSPATVRTGPRA